MKSTAFALAAGATIGSSGVLGLVAPQRFLLSGAIQNWIRIGIGAAGIVASRNERLAIMYNRGLAFSHAGITMFEAIRIKPEMRSKTATQNKNPKKKISAKKKASPRNPDVVGRL